MKSCRFPLFLIVLVSLVFYSLSSWAEGVYYTPEGLEIKKYSVPKLKKNVKKPSEVKKAPQKKITPQKKVDPKKDKEFSNPSDAVAAGYKVGQTVMVKNGIIYKLAKDSKTGKYKYKRYRKVNKKKMKPSEAAAVGYKVGQVVMVKDGIIYKLAKDSKSGKFKYKRYRAVKPKSERAYSKPKIEPAKQDDTDLKQKNAAIKAEKLAAEKVKAEKLAEEKAEAEKHTADKANAEKLAAEKAKAEVVDEAKKRKQDQEQKKPAQKLRKSSNFNGRNMNRLKMAVAFRHSFLDRKTVATERKWTENGTITPEPGPTYVGVKDLFFTDMHSDSLRFRLGLTDTIEMFIDAGFAYDKLSDIADMEPVFGLGLRYNITTIENGFFSGTYLAFSNEYHTGKLSTDFSSGGETYTQENDWQDITATVESGIVLSKMSFYCGISYMLYSESMNKKQNQSSLVNMLEMELEQQASVNLSAGVEYHYSPNLNLQLEVQTPNRQGVILSAEYRF